MNDFTKAELELLLEYTVYTNHVIAHERAQIASKLESMINSYCEHDWQDTYTEREIYRCTKCGEESL